MTSAPTETSARAVSTPRPEEAPVTMARLLVRSMPSMTLAVVEFSVKGIIMRGVLDIMVVNLSSLALSVCVFQNSTKRIPTS